METGTMFSMYRRQTMERYLEIMESQREYEDVKGVPPLGIILHRDLMETTWSSDRLLPWTPGCVLFKVYSFYLNEYFYRNTPAVFSLDAAASTCVDMEKKLSRAGVLPAEVEALSNKIKQHAHGMIKLQRGSPVATAGFMCIAEEAELMSELLACKSKNSVDKDVFIAEILDDDSFKFSHIVRKTVFDILTTYMGPCFDSVAASLLGMKKEANLLRELLKLDKKCIDRFERLNICEYLREFLLKFLIDINDCKFPELLYDTDPATSIPWKQPTHDRNSHQDMVSYLQSMKTSIEDVTDVPPLDIILYRDLMGTTWSYDRLLPWTSGYVPFDFYLVYLNEYFYRHTPATLNVHAAASSCLKIEEKLSCTGGFTADVALSSKIKELIMAINSDLESPVAAAGFMCIAEEAELMSDLLACKTKNSVDNDVFITEMDDDSFNFSNMVRKIAFDILTTYQGSCSDSVAASLLGMKKEANLLRELLKLNRKSTDPFATLKICKSLRQQLLQFLTDIHDSKFPELMSSVSGEESGKAENDGITVPSSPVTTNVTAPGTAM